MSTTLMIFAFVASSNVTGVDECMSFYYFDDQRTPELVHRLLDKCNGLCYDECTDKQRRRLDALFEWVETGRDDGWVVIQSGTRTTQFPSPRGSTTHVSRIIVITAIP